MAESAPSLLPVPAPLVEHHLHVLKESMLEWRKRGQVPPVLLLTGPRGIGKRAMAWFLAQWIFCARTGFAHDSAGEQDVETGDMFGDKSAAPATTRAASPDSAPDGLPCGACPACLKAIRGSWVDFQEISAEDPGEAENRSGNIKIDQFRNLKASQGFGAHESAYRVTLITDADRMTTQAANSALKLLEEPPKGWIFLLTASDPTLVLPTILSRCQSIRMQPLKDSIVLKLLEQGGVDEARRGVCAQLAQGGLDRATRIAQDDIWEKRPALFRFFRDPREGLPVLLDWASQDPANLELILDQLEQCAWDLIRWSVVAEQPGAPAIDRYPWRNSDGATALAIHAQSAVRRLGGAAPAREFWLKRAERIARARREAQTPVNKKLLIQDILTPWLN